MKRLFGKTKNILRGPRHARVRAKIAGTADCPRLSVHRGIKNINLQLIDDESGKTICSVSTVGIKKQKVEGKTAKVAVAFVAGKQLAEKALAKNVKRAVFDRGGYRFHGRVAAVAEGAREGGLKI